MPPREQLDHDLQDLEAPLLNRIGSNDTNEDATPPCHDQGQEDVEQECSGASSSHQVDTLSNMERDNTADDSVDRHGAPKMNQNIRYALFYAGFAFAGRSIWSQSVLAAYVYILTHSNPEAVGLMTAVMGMAQVLASIPTGYFSDMYRRDIMLKIASMVGLIAVALTLVAAFKTPRSYELLVAALAVWGIFWGIVNTALGALFADSIADGDRSYFFTQRSIIINLANVAGPTLALLMFALLGDHWTVTDCAIVMTLGQAICLPSIFVLTLLSDDHVHAAPTSPTTTSSSRGSLLTQDDSNATDFDDDEEQCPFSGTSDLTAPLLSGSEDEESNLSDSDENGNRNSRSLVSSSRFVPVMVALADVTSGLASGMSIRYFPIFFVDRLRLTPVQLQFLYIASPLLQACLMKSGQHLSQTFGRCQVTVAHKWTGVAFMAMLVLFSHYGLPAWAICIVYIMRTALMNSTAPLTRSILMDNVPKRERGRWSSLESVNMFSWSGSSFLGGFLVSWHGLLVNFSVTSALQLVATIPVIILMWTGAVDNERGRRP